MPHCIIEYTRDLESKVDIKNLIDVAFEAIEGTGLFDKTAIKGRAIAFDIYKSGQDRDDYIHVKMRILSGRTPDQKKQLSALVLNALKPHIGDTKSLTVEIIDMDIESYGKSIAE